MRCIAKQFALWRIAVVIGCAAFLIPMASGARPLARVPANERTENWSNRVERRVDVRQEGVERRTDRRGEYADQRVEVRQDVHDRRRERYQDRVERVW